MARYEPDLVSRLRNEADICAITTSASTPDEQTAYPTGPHAIKVGYVVEVRSSFPRPDLTTALVDIGSRELLRFVSSAPSSVPSIHVGDRIGVRRASPRRPVRSSDYVSHFTSPPSIICTCSDIGRNESKLDDSVAFLPRSTPIGSIWQIDQNEANTQAHETSTEMLVITCTPARSPFVRIFDC